MCIGITVNLCYKEKTYQGYDDGCNISGLNCFSLNFPKAVCCERKKLERAFKGTESRRRRRRRREREGQINLGLWWRENEIPNESLIGILLRYVKEIFFPSSSPLSSLTRRERKERKDALPSSLYEILALVSFFLCVAIAEVEVQSWASEVR